MIPIQGKHNEAKIFTDNVDNTTISQLIELCNEESFKDSKIRIMPDCHAGKGCVIGTTMTITDKVTPSLVGVDIGCGMATIEVNRDIDLKKLDEVINKYIPHGFNTHDRSREQLLLKTFKFNLRDLKCVNHIKYQRAFNAVGTLGGGNHFIEVDKASDGRLFLTVHTGSRNLGKQIAEYYQDQAIKYCDKKYGKDISSHIVADLKAKGQEHLIEQAIKEHRASIKKPTKDLCYLEGDLMKDYLHDMAMAQRYSALNRLVILADILHNYEDRECKLAQHIDFVDATLIECIHNYIDIDNMILRKGAISARKGEDLIIPINMRDGIILGKGKGNDDWNQSAPHGAGRILSRGQAKEQISLEEFKESMKDVYTTCVGQSTLDEAPQAYKPIEDILNNIGDTVEIVEILKPVYNFKSN